MFVVVILVNVLFIVRCVDVLCDSNVIGVCLFIDIVLLW